MFDEKEILIDSAQKAGENMFKALCYVDFVEDILTSIELYPNKNEYLDYSLNVELRDTLFHLLRKVESFKTKMLGKKL